MNTPPNREVSLFGAALELAGSQRAAFLDQACADDPALRQRLEDLLRLHDEAKPFLENPSPGAQQYPIVAEDQSSTLRPPVEKTGDRIGRYKLLQQIGEGGCGLVYMAEQEEPVRRRVAVKVIKLGMDTRRVVARFEAERQALALMDHPNIAKVLDAGATETGRPYFVMELVRGIKITEYCDQENLSTEQRLKLFIQVCQAVQHAHQKGIIHRDIKPSNILVADHDGVPVPKVIDFGVAKATTDQRLTDKTLFTAFEQFIGTPAYMSPEQAKLSGLDIDTRTDIYSLGVLLYELLTGKTPLDQKEMLAAGLDEMRRTIREKEPLRPSTRLSTMLEGELTTTAKHRRIDPPRLVHMLRGDLDWIVMKSLEKDRARRYQTANGFANDIERHLADEPVMARPPGKLYRFKKLARRNKLAFAAAGAVAAALVLGLTASTWEYLKERKARQRAVAAEKEAVTAGQEAAAINKFLTEDVLFQVTPEQNSREKQITLEDVLKSAARRLDTNTELDLQPKVAATLRLDLGATFFKLSALSEAGQNLSNAFHLRRCTLGPQNKDTLAAGYQLVEYLISGVHKYEEAEPLVRETLQGEQLLLGPTNRATLDTMQGLEAILHETGRLPEAERLARQIVTNSELALGRDDEFTMDAIRNLSGVVAQLGDYAQAERLNREVLTRSQRAGRQDEELISVNQIAVNRLIQGDPETAHSLLAKAVPPAAIRFGSNSSIVLWTQRIWARALADLGKLDEAEALAQQTLEFKLLTPDERGINQTSLILGRVLVERGKVEKAEPLLQGALAYFNLHPVGRRKTLAAQAANWLGAIQVARTNYLEAEKLLLPGSEEFFGPGTDMSPHELRLAVGHIVELHQLLGRAVQAASLQKKLDALIPGGKQ